MASPSLASSLQTFAELVATIETGGNEIADFSTDTEENGITVATATTEIPIFDDAVAGNVDIEIELEEITDSGIVVDIKMAATNGQDREALGNGALAHEDDAVTNGDNTESPSQDAATEQSDADAQELESESATNPDESSSGSDESDGTVAHGTKGRNSAQPDPTVRERELDDDAPVPTVERDEETTHSNDVSEASTSEQQTPEESPGDTEGNLSGDVEPYQDPELLQEVYEQHETFTEMTEALDVDVTPQTVRRYMIEYEIHEPEPQTAHLLKQVAESGVEFGQGNSNDTGEGITASSTSNSPQANSKTVDTGGNDGGSVSEGRTATDGGEPRPKDPESAENVDEDHESVSIQTLEGQIGLPGDLTLEEVCEAARDAMTLYDVERSLEIDRSEARKVLRDCNLLDTVTGRVSNGRRQITDKEIHARVTDAVANTSIETQQA